MRAWWGLAAMTIATGSVAQEVPPPVATDPVAADAAATARINADVEARVRAQSATIRQSQADYARAQADFVRAQATFEEARRRNDAERAEAAANAATYARELAAWKESVAGIAARNGRSQRTAPGKEVTVVARQPAAPVCRMETATGSQVSRRVCRSPRTVAAIREAGRVQVDDMRADMGGSTGCQPDTPC